VAVSQFPKLNIAGKSNRAASNASIVSVSYYIVLQNIYIRTGKLCISVYH
jgi:hypothetical protein